MGVTQGRKLICAYVDLDIAERFEELARQSDGGVSAALRRMIAGAVDRQENVGIEVLALVDR